ncbi:hypothetical protein [Halorientalis halophila]|uniref:hypothetical protein n=1 Tax=Halorientalis halophila TaxID=3108499 RepID=UPI0030089978
MVGITAGGSSGPDYVQPDEPANPDPLETWYDTDADHSNGEPAWFIRGTDDEWHATSVDDHGELKGVLEDSHHQYPVPTDGIADGAVTGAKAAFYPIGTGAIQDAAVTEAKVAFDTSGGPWYSPFAAQPYVLAADGQQPSNSWSSVTGARPLDFDMSQIDRSSFTMHIVQENPSGGGWAEFRLRDTESGVTEWSGTQGSGRAAKTATIDPSNTSGVLTPQVQNTDAGEGSAWSFWRLE